MSDFPIDTNGLLPHGPPMICIDSLLCATETSAEAQSRLVPGHILLHRGLLCEAGYAEMAAQTAGALKGWWEKKRGLPPGPGFLAAIQDFSILKQAREGDTLRIAVAILAEVNGLLLLEAIIRRADAVQGTRDSTCLELLAQGKLKIFTGPLPV